MKKKFKLENLGCASCASKMEEAISKLPKVTKCSINFMAAKLLMETEVETDEAFESLMEEAQGLVSKYEPSCQIVK